VTKVPERHQLKVKKVVRCQRLTPVIPATQEAKIRVGSQPGQIVLIPYLKNTQHKKLSWWSGSR
jgi:hypothetical protein